LNLIQMFNSAFWHTPLALHGSRGASRGLLLAL
jgi:hypothetical protein